jgi:hypothetical protein
MLCKIWSFHDGDYVEFRLLGYENPVHTLQETYYVSDTDKRQLMLCNIWVIHCGDWRIPSSGI